MICENQWEGCYNDSWMGDIVPESFAHPAKFSRGLINRIYQHAKEMGWVKAGDVVLDPFGGVALGGLDAMGMGLNWIGVELEPKFVALGEQNIELWNRQLRGWHNLGTARIIQGDSREIKDVIERADLVVSSPPFMDNNVNIGAVGNTISLRQQIHNSKKRNNSYGSTPGNLANMKEGDIDLVVSSPPFASTLAKESSDFTKGRERGKYLNKSVELDYGQSLGQLGSMKEGSVDAVISSPPFEGVTPTAGDPNYAWKFHGDQKYGDTKDNLGNQSGDTFWQASKEIVQGCFDLLKPGGHAIFVLKDYIKAGKRVPFSRHWASLCESAGFELVCWHRAMLVKEHGVQITLEGKEDIIKTERMSFFRRLHGQKYPHLKILWEDCICMKKGG